MADDRPQHKATESSSSSSFLAASGLSAGITNPILPKSLGSTRFGPGAKPAGTNGLSMPSGSGITGVEKKKSAGEFKSRFLKSKEVGQLSLDNHDLDQSPCSYSNENGLLKFTIREGSGGGGLIDSMGSTGSTSSSEDVRTLTEEGRDTLTEPTRKPNQPLTENDFQTTKRSDPLANSINEFLKRSDHGGGGGLSQRTSDRLSSSIKDFLDRSDKRVKEWTSYKNKRGVSSFEPPSGGRYLDSSRATSVGRDSTASDYLRPYSSGVSTSSGYRATSVGRGDDHDYLRPYNSRVSNLRATSVSLDDNHDYLKPYRPGDNNHLRVSGVNGLRATSVGPDDGMGSYSRGSYSRGGPYSSSSLRATSVGPDDGMGSYSRELYASRPSAGLRATSVGPDDGYGGPSRYQRSSYSSSAADRGTSVGRDNKLFSSSYSKTSLGRYGNGLRSTSVERDAEDHDDLSSSYSRPKRDFSRGTSVGRDKNNYSYTNWRTLGGQRNNNETSSVGKDDTSSSSYLRPNNRRGLLGQGPRATSVARDDIYDDYMQTYDKETRSKRNLRATSIARDDIFNEYQRLYARDINYPQRGSSVARDDVSAEYSTRDSTSFSRDLRGDRTSREPSYSRDPWAGDGGSSDLSYRGSRASRAQAAGPQDSAAYKRDLKSYRGSSLTRDLDGGKEDGEATAVSDRRNRRRPSIPKIRTPMTNDSYNGHARSNGRGTSVGPNDDLTGDYLKSYSRNMRAQSVVALTNGNDRPRNGSNPYAPSRTAVNGSASHRPSRDMSTFNNNHGASSSFRRGTSCEPDIYDYSSYSVRSFRSPIKGGNFSKAGVGNGGGGKFLTLEDECNWILSGRAPVSERYAHEQRSDDEDTLDDISGDEVILSHGLIDCSITAPALVK